MEDPNYTGATGPTLMSVPEFATKIKSKYPVYETVEDTALVEAMLGKYPVYKDRVDYDPVKKKDDGQLDSASVPISVEPMSVPVIGNITSEEEPESQEPEFWTGEFSWLEKTFIGDMISDVAQSAQSGQAGGQSSSEALDLLLSGSNVSDEDLGEFMKQYGLSQSYGTTDEMRSFQEDAEEFGGGFSGTILAGVKNPMAAVHMMASSMSQLANEKAMGAGAAISVSSGLAGSVVPGAGTVAAFGASIPVAMGAMGGITETGMVFQELLIKELDDRGLEFDKEGLRNILNDEEWYASARMTAIKKGGTTAIIDMVGGSLTAGAGTTLLRGGRSAYRKANRLIEAGVDVVDAIPTVKPNALSRLKLTGVAAGGDALTGGLSEAGGQLAAYGEIEGGAIAEEVIGGLGRTPLTVASSVLMGARYKVNGKKVSRSELTEVMHGMNMTDIYSAINDGTIEIQRDEGLLDLIYGDEKARVGFSSAVDAQTKASKAYDIAMDKVDKAIESGDQAAIEQAKAEREIAYDAYDSATDVVRSEGTKLKDSRNRVKPTTIRQEEKLEEKLEEKPEEKPEEKLEDKPSELEVQLNEAQAKLDEQKKLESAPAERRLKALEEAGRLDEAVSLQEQINNLQAKLDGGKTKKGKPFSKKGKEGLEKQIDNRTAELKTLYADVKIEEDVANVLSTSRERAKAQAEVDRLTKDFEQEQSTEKSREDLNKKADSFKGLQSKQKALNKEISEMKAERERLSKGGMADSPKAKTLNKDIAAAEKDLSRTNLEVQQARMADQKKTEGAVNDQLARFGLNSDRNKPAKQTVINSTKVDLDTGKETYYKGFEMGSLFNHPVIIQGWGPLGKNAFKGELRGFLRLRENGLVEFVTHDGRKHYEYGNINKGFDIAQFATDAHMAVDNNPAPTITEGGQIVVGGNVYRLATEKQFFGIDRYKNQNIKDMIVIDQDGKEVALVSNGKLKTSGKSAKAFSEEMALWAEQQNEKKKGGAKPPETFSDESNQEADTEQEPPEGPPVPPEDTDPEAAPDEPEDSGSPTADPAEREKNLKGDNVYRGPAKGSSMMQQVMPALDRLYRNTLSARGFFPKSVQDLREMRDGRLNLHARKAEQTAKQFEKIWKETSKLLNESEQADLMARMDGLFRGESVDMSGIPAEMVLTIGRMRNHIDGMSQDLLDRGLIPDKSAIDPDTQERYSSRQNIKDNIGSYVSRTYELFDGKDWASRVDGETKRQAVGYFKELVSNDKRTQNLFEEWAAKQKEKNREVLLEQYAAKQVNNILSQDSQAIQQYGPNLSPNQSPLLRKQDLDPRLRALFGERSNPMTNYIVTASRVAQLVEKGRFLSEVKDIGLKMGWLSEGTTDVGVEGFETSLEIPNINPELNPLDGMRTSPEIAKAFLETPNFFDRNIAGNTLGKVFGIAKWNKTVGSATTHARNVIGNTSFVIANGHLSTNAATTSLNEIFNPTPEGYERLMELGIIGQASNRKEITELMNSGTALDALEQRFRKNGSPFQNWGNKAWRQSGGKIAAFADKAYLAEDDFFKVYGFEIEKGRYAKAMFGESFGNLNDQQQQQVEERSAAIIKDVYPNYNRIGPLIAGLSKFPAVGTFLAFRAESFRVSYNIMRLAYQELQDPATKAIGAKRLAGISSYLGGKAAIQSSMGAASGYGLLGLMGGGKQEGEEEGAKTDHKNDYDDLAYFVRPWEKSGYEFRELGSKENVISDQIVVTDIDREKGIVKYRNMSTVDGFSDPTAVFQRMMAGAQGKGTISDNKMIDAFAGGLIELVGPFVEEEMTTGMLNQFSNNAKASGAPIWNPEDDASKIMSDVYDHFFQLLPSVFAQSKKMAEGGYGDTPTEAFMGIIGLGELEVNVLEQMQFGVIPEFKDRLARNDKIRYRPEEYVGGSSSAEYIEVVKQKNERDKDAYKELSQYVQAAVNLGVDDELLRVELDRLRLPKKVFMNGEEQAFGAVDLIFLGQDDFIDLITPDYDRDYKGER